MNEDWKLKPCKISWRSKDTKGYAKINQKTFGYSRHHRYVYAREHSVKLTPDQHVCHHCDNPGCIEITHLFLGSNQDNVNDKVNKGRQAGSPGEANGNSVLTESDVRKIRELGRKGYFTSSIADQFKVSENAVRQILKGRTWTHVCES